ncbi:MAG TPA: hypothetical protein VFJ74_02555 [Gemmatimonadaceae bacterium]|nr:hypothetical protein [Gemmatimonadaceae bacterium]
MDPLKGRRVGAVVADVADTGVALFAAVWPRSMAKFEISRLAADGYTAGQTYDVDFSVALESELADVALPAMRDAGFTVGGGARLGDGSRKAADGFVTVRRRVRLRAYDLSREQARLNRLASRFGGWAAVIGPSTPPPESSAVSPLADARPAAAAPAPVDRVDADDREERVA